MHGQPTERPDHFAPLANLFERIKRGERVMALVSAPPQFGKSELLAHGGAQVLAHHPEWPMLYVSYGDSLAEEKSRLFRDYARASGVELREDAESVATWLTPANGGLRARGIFSPITGNPSKLTIVDDPHKNRAEAESALIREKTHQEFNSSVRSRSHPDSSIIVCHARWHPDDLIGRLEKELDENGKPVWEVINLPAILTNGQPLWHRRPLSWLETVRRRNENDWHSLYMGKPQSAGDVLFRGVHFYDKLPFRYTVGKGADLAYSEKTRACYSCGVTMIASIDSTGDNPDPDPWFYVVDVQRAQCEVPAFASMLSAVELDWPGGAWHWFASAQERGVAQLLREMGVDFNDVLATEDKRARAQPVATAWNRGRILVPRNMAALLGDRARNEDHKTLPPWLKPFVDEVARFTGAKGETNDQVDAFASAYESVRHSSPSEATVVPDGSSRWDNGGGRGFG